MIAKKYKVPISSGLKPVIKVIAIIITKFIERLIIAIIIELNTAICLGKLIFKMTADISINDVIPNVTPSWKK